MITMPFLTFNRVLKHLVALVLSSFLAVNAHAVLINFDDLTYVPVDPEDPFFADVPLDTQYLSQGLSISNAYLTTYDSADDPDFISGPNRMLAGGGGEYMTLSFVGALPTFVGMYVAPFSGEMLFLDAYGPGGLLASIHTIGDGGPFNPSAPYVPRQYVTFESAMGISSIDMSAFYSTRLTGYVDDITYTYADVPEPSSLLLFGLGALALGYRRYKGSV